VFVFQHFEGAGGGKVNNFISYLPDLLTELSFYDIFLLVVAVFVVSFVARSISRLLGDESANPVDLIGTSLTKKNIGIKIVLMAIVFNVLLFPIPVLQMTPVVKYANSSEAEGSNQGDREIVGWVLNEYKTAIEDTNGTTSDIAHVPFFFGATVGMLERYIYGFPDLGDVAESILIEKEERESNRNGAVYQIDISAAVNENFTLTGCSKNELDLKLLNSYEARLEDYELEESCEALLAEGMEDSLVGGTDRRLFGEAFSDIYEPVDRLLSLYNGKIFLDDIASHYFAEKLSHELLNERARSFNTRYSKETIKKELKKVFEQRNEQIRSSIQALDTGMQDVMSKAGSSSVVSDIIKLARLSLIRTTGGDAVSVSTSGVSDLSYATTVRSKEALGETFNTEIDSWDIYNEAQEANIKKYSAGNELHELANNTIFLNGLDESNASNQSFHIYPVLDKRIYDELELPELPSNLESEVFFLTNLFPEDSDISEYYARQKITNAYYKGFMKQELLLRKVREIEKEFIRLLSKSTTIGTVPDENINSNTLNMILNKLAVTNDGISTLEKNLADSLVYNKYEWFGWALDLDLKENGESNGAYVSYLRIDNNTFTSYIHDLISEESQSAYKSELRQEEKCIDSDCSIENIMSLSTKSLSDFFDNDYLVKLFNEKNSLNMGYFNIDSSAVIAQIREDQNYLTSNKVVAGDSIVSNSNFNDTSKQNRCKVPLDTYLGSLNINNNNEVVGSGSVTISDAYAFYLPLMENITNKEIKKESSIINELLKVASNFKYNGNVQRNRLKTDFVLKYNELLICPNNTLKLREDFVVKFNDKFEAEILTQEQSLDEQMDSILLFISTENSADSYDEKMKKISIDFTNKVEHFVNSQGYDSLAMGNMAIFNRNGLQKTIDSNKIDSFYSMMSIGSNKDLEKILSKSALSNSINVTNENDNLLISFFESLTNSLGKFQNVALTEGSISASTKSKIIKDEFVSGIATPLYMSATKLSLGGSGQLDSNTTHKADKISKIRTSGITADTEKSVYNPMDWISMLFDKGMEYLSIVLIWVIILVAFVMVATFLTFLLVGTFVANHLGMFFAVGVIPISMAFAIVYYGIDDKPEFIGSSIKIAFLGLFGWILLWIFIVINLMFYNYVIHPFALDSLFDYVLSGVTGASQEGEKFYTDVVLGPLMLYTVFLLGFSWSYLRYVLSFWWSKTTGEIAEVKRKSKENLERLSRL
jgi:hypothetical protein